MTLFRFEKDMKPPVVRWLQAQGMHVRNELRNYWGVLDLAGCEFDSEKIAKRLALRQRQPIPVWRLKYFLMLPESPGSAVAASDLATLCHGLSRVESELEWLKKMRYASRCDDGRWWRVADAFPIHNRVVAVELKLSRLAEVIAQARNNREMTWESYVGLPADAAERIASGKRAAEFREHGIGLLAVTPGDCRALIEPREVKPCNLALQMYCVERMWRTRDEDWQPDGWDAAAVQEMTERFRDGERSLLEGSA